jgi:hypothetical protein
VRHGSGARIFAADCPEQTPHGAEQQKLDQAGHAFTGAAASYEKLVVRLALVGDQALPS